MRAQPASGYQLDADPARIDHDVLWEFLSTQAYWARWRTAADVRAAVEGSWRVVGCYRDGDMVGYRDGDMVGYRDGDMVGYRDGGEMVGFARAISDGVNFAYLADVFVLRSHRGHGLGKAIVSEMIDNGPGRDFRWLLHTLDAGGLYRGFGFAEPHSTAMERPSARPAMAPVDGPQRQ